MQTSFTRMVMAFITLVAMGLCTLQPTPVAAQGQSGTTLTASKTATGHWERTFRWTIDKAVTPATWNLFNGDSGTSPYTIAVTKDSGTTAIWVDGQICVTNGGALDTAGLTIWDDVLYKAGAGQFQVLTSVQVDTSAKPILKPGEQYCYAYTINITPVANAQYKNSARITITNHSGKDGPFGPSPDAPFSIPATPTLINDTINVNDNVGTPGDASDDKTWLFTAGGSVTYDRPFTCPSDLALYQGGHYPYTLDNTATIQQTGQADNAQVKVDCYIPLVKKTAAGSYTEKHDWSLTKSASTTSLSGFAGGSAGSTTWTVTVDKTVTKGTYAVEGTITIQNPNPAAAMTVAVSDLLDDATVATITDCSGDANLADGLTVAAGSTATCNYTASPEGHTATKNTATVTLNNIAYSAKADVTFVPIVVGPTAVTVSDDRAPAGTFANPVSDDAEFKYKESFKCSADLADYDKDGKRSTAYPNTALLKDGATEIASAQAVVTVDCYRPLISKSAAGAYDERHLWDIDKSVTPATQSAFAGDTVAYQWTVTLNETVKEENFAVTGQITVQNPHPTAELTVELADKLDDDTGAAISSCTGGDLAGSTLTIPAGGQAVCDYEAKPTDQTANQNTATATFNGVAVTASVPVQWTANVIDPEVTVDDDQNPAFPLTVNAGDKWTYKEEYTCSADQTAYSNGGVYAFSDANTALVSANDTTLDSAKATAEVRCYAPVVHKDAQTSLTRTYHWSIEKTADQAGPLTLSINHQFVVNYKVTLSAESTDSTWAVAGKITIQNPNPDAAMTVDLADVLSDGTVATITACTGDTDLTDGLTIAADTTATCSYEADLSNADKRTNSATATLNGIAFIGEAAVSFANAQISEVDECSEVTDDQQGDLGPHCAKDLPKTISYSRYVGSYTTCGDYEAKNTATFTTTDTDTTGSASWTIAIKVPCKGCTLTIGYWKAHAGFTGNNPDKVTPLLPRLLGTAGGSKTQNVDAVAKAVQFLSFYGSNNVFDASNGINKLYAQLLAAKLSIANGADGSAVAATISAADTFLATKNSTDWSSLTKTQKADVQKWMSALDNYNNGLTGPGHCSENNVTVLITREGNLIVVNNSLFIPLIAVKQ